MRIVDEEHAPPFRFIGGADAIAQAEKTLGERQKQIEESMPKATARLSLGPRSMTVRTGMAQYCSPGGR